jgi:hypothetical protein
MDINNIMPFGKYKGQPIEVLAQDQGYCKWLLSQAGIKDKYPIICQIIINNFGVPNDTPEHNALQAHFLDDYFCLALAGLINWLPIDRTFSIQQIEEKICYTENQIKNLKDTNNDNSLSSQYRRMIEERNSGIYNCDNKNQLQETLKNLLNIKEIFYSKISTFKIDKDFENGGWDITLDIHDSIYYFLYLDEQRKNGCKIAIEIKPSLGDDYPNILRQMKNTNIRLEYQCLVYDKYNAIGATLDDIKKIFSSPGFWIFSIGEIENAQKLIK